MRKGNIVVNDMNKVNSASADISVENSIGNNAEMPNQNAPQPEETKSFIEPEENYNGLKSGSEKLQKYPHIK